MGYGRAYDFVHFSPFPLFCRVFPINVHEPLYNLIFTRFNDSREIRNFIDKFPFFVVGERVSDIGRWFGQLKDTGSVCKRKSSRRDAVTEDRM